MRALVVDDSRMARHVLGSMLKKHDIDVDSVQSAEEALGFLCSELPDMIFMDHTMPGMDGFQALRAIKNDPRTSAIPIMMYTSKEGEVYMNQARKLGAADVLPKELKAGELKAVLTRQQLLPGQQPSKPAPPPPSTAKVTAPAAVQQPVPETAPAAVDDAIPEDNILEATQAAEKSIESKQLNEQLRPLLDEHRHQLTEQTQQRTEQLLQRFDERLDAMSDEIRHLASSHPERKTFWQAVKTLPGVLTVILLLVLLVWGVINQVDKHYQLQQVKTQIAQLRAIIDEKNTKATAKQIALRRRLQLVTGSQQRQSSEWLKSFEWAINQENRFAWNGQPFSDELANKLSTIAERLEKTGFVGSMIVISHLGTFCLLDTNNNLRLPAAGSKMSNCKVRQMDQQQQAVRGMAQSLKFSNFMTSFQQEYAPDLQLELTTQGSQRPRQAYPVPDTNGSATTWNKAATQNNWVEIRLKPRRS